MSADTLTMDDVKAYVAGKAVADADFRKALLADPKSAVARLLRAELPPQVTIQVIEEAPGSYVVVVPAAPATGELSDADLEAVAGGAKARVDHRQNAQMAASIVFGGAAGLSAIVIGEIAGAKEKGTGQHIKDQGTKIALCGAF